MMIRDIVMNINHVVAAIGVVVEVEVETEIQTQRHAMDEIDVVAEVETEINTPIIIAMRIMVEVDVMIHEDFEATPEVKAKRLQQERAGNK